MLASVESTRVQESILDLAQMTQSSSQINTVDGDEDGTMQHEMQDLVPRIFRLLGKVAVDLADFWEDNEVIQTGAKMLAMLLPQLNVGSPFIGAAYWLVLRLGKQRPKFSTPDADLSQYWAAQSCQQRHSVCHCHFSHTADCRRILEFLSLNLPRI